jgi:hypothetical protein
MVTIDEQQTMRAIQAIPGLLNRIVNLLEAQEMRARERISYDPKSLGMLALWREEVARGDCRIGFTDWQAWHESEQGTTPEDIENVGEAIAAVKRGFADMEAQVKGEGDASGQ